MKTQVIRTRMHACLCAGFIILLGVVLNGCATAPARTALTATVFVTPPPEEHGRVTVSVFSGRPNPTWPLSSEEQAFIQTSLPTFPTTTAQVPDGGLGYQGFSIELRDPITRTTITMTVFNGVITVTTPTSHEVRQDDSRAFERWLMEHTKPHIPSPLYDTLAQELAR
jgi:hypothetical protein